MSDRLLSLKEEEIWFWARGVPTFDNLCSNGMSATIFVMPDSTALIERTIDLLKCLLEELVEHDLIE